VISNGVLATGGMPGSPTRSTSPFVEPDDTMVVAREVGATRTEANESELGRTGFFPASPGSPKRQELSITVALTHIRYIPGLCVILPARALPSASMRRIRDASDVSSARNRCAGSPMTQRLRRDESFLRAVTMEPVAEHLARLEAVTPRKGEALFVDGAASSPRPRR
jgi:hypothetical protein